MIAYLDCVCDIYTIVGRRRSKRGGPTVRLSAGDKELVLGAFVRCDVVGSSVGGRRAAVIEQEPSWNCVVERYSAFRLYGHPVCDTVKTIVRANQHNTPRVTYKLASHPKGLVIWMFNVSSVQFWHRREVGSSTIGESEPVDGEVCREQSILASHSPKTSLPGQC